MLDTFGQSEKMVDRPYADMVVVDTAGGVGYAVELCQCLGAAENGREEGGTAGAVKIALPPVELGFFAEIADIAAIVNQV